MWPPTLWRAIEALDGDARTTLLETVAVNPDLPPHETMTVRAPCCGRRCAADMVLDLRSIPGTPTRHQTDAEWACDGCWTWMVRHPGNGWTRSKLFRAAGAPPEVIRGWRARELAHERENARSKAKPRQWSDPAGLLAEALAELPEGTVEVPGTEAP